MKVLAHNGDQGFSICYGDSEGCTKLDCETVSIYVDALNESESTG